MFIGPDDCAKFGARRENSPCQPSPSRLNIPPVKKRAVSSVVEHYLDTVGVTGSNPVPRTIPKQWERGHREVHGVERGEIGRGANGTLARDRAEWAHKRAISKSPIRTRAQRQIPGGLTRHSRRMALALTPTV